jgi:hypothetical protein
MNQRHRLILIRSACVVVNLWRKAKVIFDVELVH